MLVDAARDFGEDVGTVLITDLPALVDRDTRLGGDLGERTRERLHVGATFGDLDRIGLERAALRHDLDRAFGGRSQLHGALGDQVDQRDGAARDLVEEFVQRDELRTLHVPMRLLRL
jgi:hypothetical protein